MSRNVDRTVDRAFDLAAIGVASGAALILAGEAESSGRITGEPLFWALMIGIISAVLLWWRRTHPVHVGLAVAALSAFSELTAGAVLIAVYTVATLRRWPAAVAVAAVCAVVVIPYTVVGPDDDLSVAASNVFNVAFLAVATASGMAVRARRELAASVLEQARQAVAEARLQEDRLRARERERIAREMHDVLAHRISLVSLHAGALEVRHDLTPEQVTATAATIRASAHQALVELREILGVLRSEDGGGPLLPQPGLADLPRLVEDSRDAGTRVEVDDRLTGRTGSDPRDPGLAAIGRTVYRIVQEGLTNAAKHAPGAPVRVSLEPVAGGEVHVAVLNELPRRSDGGAQEPAIPGSRSGLVGLAERVRLAGGRLEHGACQVSDGEFAFRLEAWLPCPGTSP